MWERVRKVILYVLLISIYSILFLSFFLLALDALRRIRNKIYYIKKDRLKHGFMELLRNFSESKKLEWLEPIFRKPPISKIERQALFEALLHTSGLSAQEILHLSKKTGLKEYYVAKLKSKRAFERGESYKKLAFLGSAEDVHIIFESLKEEKDPEVNFVGLMSLAKLLESEDLRPFLDLLETKFRKSLLNMRSVAIIINEVGARFGEIFVNIIIEYIFKEDKDDYFISAILDGLYFSPIKTPLFKDLSEYLLKVKHNPEIVARALKLLSKIPDYLTSLHPEKIIPYLQHEEWIVRLQALRVCKYIISIEFLDKLVPLLSDKNYLVRREAAQIIVLRLIDESPQKISDLFKMTDRFAVESLFEVMVKEYSLKKEQKYLNFLSQAFVCFYSTISSNSFNIIDLDYGTS